jgi:hypothetical protein
MCVSVCVCFCNCVCVRSCASLTAAIRVWVLVLIQQTLRLVGARGGGGQVQGGGETVPMRQGRYVGVTLVLQWCYSGITMMLL